jgi:glucose/arabinose dehydrogenase
MPPAVLANHQSLIIEWQVTNPSNPSSVVNPASARKVLSIDQPQFNHNGGALNFGPDGMLYIGVGDGGAANDLGVGHTTSIGNAQDTTNILGTILRIDPTGSNSANGQYSIPADNPFVGQAGFLDEIWAYGMRNPYRFSFDMETGNLYLGDVGQSNIEEVDIVMAGTNCGWRYMEGSFFFHMSPTPHVTLVDPGVPGGLFGPVAEYDHDEGTAVIGGFVYRGSEIPSLRGRYVFGDLAQTSNSDGRVLFLKKKNLEPGKTSKISEFKVLDTEELGIWLFGFGQDANGELYLLGNTTGVPFPDSNTGAETGVILRIASKKCE